MMCERRKGEEGENRKTERGKEIREYIKNKDLRKER